MQSACGRPAGRVGSAQLIGRWTMPEKRGARAGTRQQRQEAAAELAITALCFLADEPERLARFLALSGIAPESIRAAAGDPGFLVGVLDYLANHETLLI